MYSQHNPAELILSDPLVLSRLKVQATRLLGTEFAAGLTLDVANDVAGRLLVSLNGYVLAEKLADEIIVVEGDARSWVYIPDGVWQTFKATHASAWWMCWLIRRQPVLERPIRVEIPWSKRVAVKQFAVFPASPIRTPEHLRGPIIVRHEHAEQCG